MTYSLILFLNAGTELVNIKRIDFSRYNVITAFTILFTVVQNTVKLSDVNFHVIRNSCVARASEPLRRLLKHTIDTNSLFEVLAENNKYCNWINVRYLKDITIACDNKQLQSLIENYTNFICSKRLPEIWNNLPLYIKIDSIYSELKATFVDKDLCDITLGELIKCECEPKAAKWIAMLTGLDYDGYPGGGT